MAPPLRNSNARKYQVRHDFFDRVETEEQAYFLGLLSADGWVQSSIVGIELTQQDAYLLDYMKRAMCAEQPIKTRARIGKKPSKYLYIFSIRLVEALGKLGVTSKKSLTLKFPELPTSVYRHYVRGFFDGDGTTGRYEGRLRTSICGPEEFLTAMNTQLSSCGIVGNIRPHGIIHRLHFGPSAAKTLAHLMYTDSTVCLLRKKEILCK